MMKILITGTSNGIGLEAAKRFLEKGYEVIGFDLEETKINDKNLVFKFILQYLLCF